VEGPTEGSVVSLNYTDTNGILEGWNGDLDADFYPMDESTYYDVRVARYTCKAEDAD
jgi:hypothetical protein